MDILIPVIAIGILGAVFGIGLALASQRFKVEIDPRLEKIHGLLPGSNCGACGGAGCFGFAEAVLSGKMKIDKCRVSSDAAKEEIAGILGRKLIKDLKKIAVLHCNGGRKVKDRFVYQGTQDCVAANLVLGGQKACVFGCLGFGSCVNICPFGALAMSAENLPVVEKNKCKACNKCVQFCPNKIFALITQTATVCVACSSHDLGKETKAACPVGCIACKLCEKACQFDAIHVLDASTASFDKRFDKLTVLGTVLSKVEGLRDSPERSRGTLSINPEQSRRVDNLAVIDYNKCTSCGECVKVCPMKTIRIRS